MKSMKTNTPIHYLPSIRIIYNLIHPTITRPIPSKKSKNSAENLKISINYPFVMPHSKKRYIIY